MGGPIFGHPVKNPLGAMCGIRAALVQLIALAMLLAACRPSRSDGGAFRFVDDAGDTLELAHPAQRIVSLIPATTEILFAIGAGRLLVGRSFWCDYPDSAVAVPNLGDGIQPNIELVVAKRPDLVLLYNSAGNASAAQRLRDFDIAAMRLNTDALRDVGRVARLLGRLTGHEREADSVVAALDRGLAEVSVQPDSAALRVLIVAWEEPPMTIGGGSFLSELIERAGARNLFADIRASSAPVSIEAIAAREPDLIFTTSEGLPGFAKRPEWQVVRAVRERRFVNVRSSAYNRPSPRAPQAIRELAAKLREQRP